MENLEIRNTEVQVEMSIIFINVGTFFISHQSNFNASFKVIAITDSIVSYKAVVNNLAKIDGAQPARILWTLATTKFMELVSNGTFEIWQ